MIVRWLQGFGVVLGAMVLEGCATTPATAPTPAPSVEKRPAKKAPRAKRPAPVVAAVADDVADVEAPPAVPADDDPAALPPVLAEGVASFYSDALAGRKTANGERYDPGAHTCAHRTLPFGTVVIVEEPTSGRSSRCRVNDRGPFSGGRIIDLSRKVAVDLGIIEQGVARVRLRVVAP